MKSKISLKNCGNHDVVAFNSTLLKVENMSKEVEHLFFNQTLLGAKLTELLNYKKILKEFSSPWSEDRESQVYENWFNDGVDCELLRLGAQQWKQGKLRINFNVSLEFVPDEAENEITPQITVPESNIKYQYQNRNKSAA
ncbi:MAG: KGK domain-containing protein [Nostocaceae cyanobacterium]|nr:KGK domain-containing protein [Nostocaceae cyanobacterium]